MKSLSNLLIIIFCFFLVDSNLLFSQKPVIIDERQDSSVITLTIEIDQVWAGHPVGFCLLTEDDRQYVAYYNANRNMVVGQRNLDEDHFDLTVMPATSRETHGGWPGIDERLSIITTVDERRLVSHVLGMAGYTRL